MENNRQGYQVNKDIYRNKFKQFKDIKLDNLNLFGKGVKININKFPHDFFRHNQDLNQSQKIKRKRNCQVNQLVLTVPFTPSFFKKIGQSGQNTPNIHQLRQLSLNKFHSESHVQASTRTYKRKNLKSKDLKISILQQLINEKKSNQFLNLTFAKRFKAQKTLKQTPMQSKIISPKQKFNSLQFIEIKASNKKIEKKILPSQNSYAIKIDKLKQQQSINFPPIKSARQYTR